MMILSTDFLNIWRKRKNEVHDLWKTIYKLVKASRIGGSITVSLVQNFNKVTKEIKAKEEPVVKVCSFCKKKTTDWIQNITWDTGVPVESQTFIRCEKCRVKQLKKEKRYSK